MIISVWITKTTYDSFGLNQSLGYSAIYEHRCLENIKKLYKYSGKCDDWQQYKAILEAAMVSTTSVFTENSTMSYIPSMTVNIIVQENHFVNFL